MAKSKVEITFISTLWENDVFRINVTTPVGNLVIQERFVNNIANPRPSGYVQISTDFQAQRFYDALVEDYSAIEYVTFAINGNKVTIEAKYECEFPNDCVEYTVSTYTNASITYTDCDGTEVSLGIGGASGYDAETFCAQEGSLYTSGPVNKAITGNCGGAPSFGPTLFTVIQTPGNTDAFSVLLSNNDCSGDTEDQTVNGVDFSEASSDPCNNINACITTQKLLVLLGTINQEITKWDVGYLQGRSDNFFNTGQWRTIPVNITQSGNCPDLYSVTSDDFISWTFQNASFNPNLLNPTPFQFFLRNNSIVRTITVDISYHVYVSTSYNSVYDLFMLHTDSVGSVKEWRHLSGNQSVNVGEYDYDMAYSGDFDLAVGDNLMLVQHILGSIAGSTIVNYIYITDFLFSVTCEEDNTTPNTENPICLDIPRGEDYLLEGYDADGLYFSYTVTAPVSLAVDDISVIWENQSSLVSIVTVEHSTGLTLMYNIDGGTWQTSNVFELVPGNAYTLYIKDEYGCEINIPFLIDEEVYNQPSIVQRRACNSLHELNVGKYLNLCGKQHTMKIGFVCNVQPNTIKIFKHIQMILNTDYAIKNAVIKTSNNQERFVPGTHMIYRIRESMHSVPLKNPEDTFDLRGSWAYLELEIESIDNQKVDLFSVITHLRKSTI